MDVDFEWDSKKAEKVLTERGIRFEDVESEVRANRARLVTAFKSRIFNKDKEFDNG